MNRNLNMGPRLLLSMLSPAVIVGCMIPGQVATNNPSLVQVAVNSHDAGFDQAEADDTQLLQIYQRSDENRPVLVVQSGRYSARAAVPTPSQRYPLQIIIDVRIPEDIVTIEQTIGYLLRRSGYTLTADLSPDVMVLLSKPLPDVHRTLGPMRLIDALTVLIAPNYAPVADSKIRVINYRPVSEPMGAPL